VRRSADSAPSAGVGSNRCAGSAFAAARDRARARAVAPRPRRGFRVRANVIHQPTRRKWIRRTRHRSDRTRRTPLALDAIRTRT
jgi:hypothetical protein